MDKEDEMKTTGMVRRVDELGRIVIPKEIRKTMRLLEGENIEIFVRDDEIVLKKYSLVKKISDFAQDFTDAMYSFLKENVIVTDTDSVIAISGSLRKDYLNKYLSDSMLMSIRRHENILEKHKKTLEIIDGQKIECTYILKPIFVRGDIMGMVIILSLDNKLSEEEEKVANIAAEFFMKYLEE